MDLTEVLTRAGASPILIQEALSHLELVCRLERLADHGGDEALLEESLRGDKAKLRENHVVQVKVRQRWRYTIVEEVHGTGVVVSYFSPTALDKAQNIWISRSRGRLDTEHPRRAAELALATPGLSGHQSELARKAFSEALLFLTIALGCTRRPWAALVPLRRARFPLHEVYLAPDQRLGTPGYFPL